MKNTYVFLKENIGFQGFRRTVWPAIKIYEKAESEFDGVSGSMFNGFWTTLGGILGAKNH